MTAFPDAAIDSRCARWTIDPTSAAPATSCCEPIGRGGMGIVFRGRDRELDRDVAIKVTTWSTAADADRLRAEARTLARLEHPGIVPVHDVGQLPDGRVFTVMMLVRGERLDVRAAALPLLDRLRLFDRICDTVSFAHARGRHAPRSEAGEHHDRRARPGARPRLGRSRDAARDGSGAAPPAAPTATWRRSRTPAVRRAVRRLRARRDPARSASASGRRDHCVRSPRSSRAPPRRIPAQRYADVGEPGGRRSPVRGRRRGRRRTASLRSNGRAAGANLSDADRAWSWPTSRCAALLLFWTRLKDRSRAERVIGPVKEDYCEQTVLGLVLGGVLGIFDGLSALVSAPNDPAIKAGIVGIVIGSTIKGILTGALIGWYAKRAASLASHDRVRARGRPGARLLRLADAEAGRREPPTTGRSCCRAGSSA